ncbi:SLAM family member 9-like [Garra rufa]|uniref:SLAM family member 9-like n=1 Tax=Garra rufa TaxID=137080 RepID=UPI003CCE7361
MLLKKNDRSRFQIDSDVALLESHLYVFGKSVSVTEGESITINSNVTKIRDDEDILWKFGAEKSLIAEISKAAGIISTFYDPGGRFKDRLKLDKQTGSLTITNITNEHAGVYQLVISGAKRLSITYRVSVYAPLSIPNITRETSQCPSLSSASNCSLTCSVLNVSHATLSWYKGNSLLSSVSVTNLSISLSLPLEVEHTDNNTYSCVVNNPISNQTQHLDISELCWPCLDQGLPLFYIVLISAGSLLTAAAVMMCCICSDCRQSGQENNC